MNRYADLIFNGGSTVKGLPAPTLGTDAANKTYVDGAISGLSWKDNVRAASTANATITSAYANGQTVDGVTLVTGDRILLKNQTTGADNGIYTVNVSGAPTRTTDADAATELLGMTVQVDEGTANANTIWMLTTNAPITVNSTSLAFTQLNIAAYSAGNGISVTGTVIAVVPVSGGGISVGGSGVSVDTTVVARKAAATIGDGTSTSINFDHNLATLDTVVQVYQVSDGAQVECDIVRPPGNNNRVTLTFSVAPTSSQFRVVVQG